ncbi:DUF4262 domain-containing protein [Catenulispora sp. NF23]|uniref:DUF4262 domain-containing protein n=1 Tax=Catenulispora pinistramenti TaxID=2705254 RepID=UPI001BA51EB7|nr:DUF4262 domain-containing protein [Catenulispora pinistramenti]MBS2537314.1 DUF4262 domain-containing protein [Catenulispora pinistramenti]
MDIEPTPCHCLLCQPPALNEAQWDPRDREIANNVRTHGWHTMGVTSHETPDWAYSIGMWHSNGGFDICITGLPAENAMALVAKIARQVRDGRGLGPEKRRQGVIEGYELATRPVHPSWYPAMFGAGLDYFQTPPWPMLQAVWPDRAGRFPWEEGADPEKRDQQPFLWLAREEHPAGMWVTSSLSL